MTDVDPNRRPSNAGRYLFLLVLGLVLGVIATVMAMRALEQRKDHFPEALMHVQQWHMGQLKADMDANRCNATDILPHLQALRFTSNDLDAAFPSLRDDTRFTTASSAMRAATDKADRQSAADLRRPRRDHEIDRRDLQGLPSGFPQLRLVTPRLKQGRSQGGLVVSAITHATHVDAPSTSVNAR